MQMHPILPEAFLRVFYLFSIMLISVYKDSFDIESQITEELQAILSGIKSGRWQDKVLPIMKETDKDKRQELKRKVPAYTVSGKFSKRSRNNLVEHSNFIAIDFDDIKDINQTIQELKKDEYSFAVFKSVSHRGICCIVKIEGSRHLDAFNGLSQYYWNLLGVSIDQACKDISRLRYVSYDPDLYLNDKSKTFNKYLTKQENEDLKKSNHVQVIHSDKRFGDVLNYIEEKQIDITGRYPQWVSIGFAIASKYGKHGFEYFDLISSFSQLYDKDKTTNQYALCCRKWEGDKVVTINSFYYYAKKSNVPVYSESEQKQINAAEISRDTGMSMEDAIKVIENEGILPDEEIIKEVYKQPKETKKKDSKLDIEAVKFFLSRYQIKKNELTRRYEWRGQEMGTEDFNTIYLEAKAYFEKLSNDMFMSIIYSHFTKIYNPIKEYFDSITWDGIDRIEPLVESITSDTGTPIFRYTAVRSWLLGIIESVFANKPNILQLILAGKQNTGKSVFFKELLPTELKRYLALSQLDSGKDDNILMCEKLIILDDEYSGKSKKDAKMIKRLLSAPYFNLREPYGKQNIQMNRIASLCATTNETEILNDVTGNRRNLVLEITDKFDFAKYNTIDKGQLFAQLYQLHKEGFESDLTQEMIDQLHEFTNGRNSETNMEADAIDKFFYPASVSDNLSYLTSTEIMAIIVQNWKIPIGIRKLGLTLRALNYERKKVNDVYKYKITPKMPNNG